MKNRKAKYILGTEATAWAECVQPKLLQLHFHCFDAVDCKNHS